MRRTWNGGTSVVLFIFGLLYGPATAFAQDETLAVVVNNSTYLVTNGAVTPKSGSEPLDPTIIEKARFAARVVDQQLVNSPFNKAIFAPTFRAVVFRDLASGRLAPPWRRPYRAETVETLEKSKRQLRQWASDLASDPRKLMLFAAKRDYEDGIQAIAKALRSSAMS